jgi:hypothetical protein
MMENQESRRAYYELHESRRIDHGCYLRMGR